nr:hypothetical protein [Bradyrhizobium arachidis]
MLGAEWKRAWGYYACITKTATLHNRLLVEQHDLQPASLTRQCCCHADDPGAHYKRIDRV